MDYTQIKDIFKYEPFYRAYIKRKYSLNEVQFSMLLYMYDRRVAKAKELYDMSVANGFKPGTFPDLKSKLLLRVVKRPGSNRVHYSATTLLDTVIEEYFDYILMKREFKLHLGTNPMLSDRNRGTVHYMSKYMKKINQEREQHLAQE